MNRLHTFVGDPLISSQIPSQPHSLPRLANSLDRFLDSDSKTSASNLVTNFSQYNHILANEPTIAMYRITDHIRRKVPETEQRVQELSKQQATAKGGELDAGYAVASVNAWKEHNTGAKYANMHQTIAALVARCKQSRSRTPITPVLTSPKSSPSLTTSATSTPKSPVTSPPSPVRTPIEQKTSVDISTTEQNTPTPQTITNPDTATQESQPQLPNETETVVTEPEQQQHITVENAVADITDPQQEDNTPSTIEVDTPTEQSSGMDGSWATPDFAEQPKTPKSSSKKKKKKKKKDQPVTLTLKQF